LELGISRGYGAGVVAKACPSVEIYGVDRWEGILYGNSPEKLSNALHDVGLRGYLRFLNGDIDTAVQRLRDSFAGPFSLDLAFVRSETLSTNALDDILGLISSLAPGGALILTDPSADQFAAVWNRIQERFPDFVHFQSKDRRTGMLLATSLMDKDKDRSIVLIEDVHFDKAWFIFLKMKTSLKRLVLSFLKPAIPFLRRVMNRLMV